MARHCVSTQGILFFLGLHIHAVFAVLLPKGPHHVGALQYCDNALPDPPTLCPKGNKHWTPEELRKALPEFSKLYKTRPIDKNMNGVNANHAFSLWFTIHKLKPKYIIESGVYRGFTTWLMRNTVGNATKIFSFDPVVNRWPVYTDTTGLTKYYLGKDFKDMALIDWDELIPAEARSETFVMLDDHQPIPKRLSFLLNHNFTNIWDDDNWVGVDTYSPNTLCSPVTSRSEKWLRNNLISLNTHSANVKALVNAIEVYFEFPAIFDGCNTSRPALLSTEEELSKLDLPSVDSEGYHYLHMSPPYVKLKTTKL